MQVAPGFAVEEAKEDAVAVIVVEGAIIAAEVVAMEGAVVVVEEAVAGADMLCAPLSGGENSRNEMCLQSPRIPLGKGIHILKYKIDG